VAAKVQSEVVTLLEQEQVGQRLIQVELHRELDVQEAVVAQRRSGSVLASGRETAKDTVVERCVPAV